MNHESQITLFEILQKWLEDININWVYTATNINFNAIIGIIWINSSISIHVFNDYVIVYPYYNSCQPLSIIDPKFFENLINVINDNII